MEIKTNVQPIESSRGDLLVVSIFEGITKLTGAAAAVDTVVDGLLTKTIKERKFKGSVGEALMIQTIGKIPAKRVLLVGLGQKASFSLETVRRVSGIMVSEAKRIYAKKMVSILHGAGNGGLNPRDCARALTEGVLLANYAFVKYKKDGAKKALELEIKEVVILESDRRSLKAIEQGIVDARLEVEATIVARDLVNEPPSNMTPRHLVEVAKEIARKNRGVRVKIYNRAELERMGAGALLGMARGSDEEPFLVHLMWKPAKAKKSVAICGKGITFDSGGLSIKPGEHMYTMKLDMAGAAAVLGLFSKIRELAPPVEVHGIFGACENMPSGKAIKPGDIVSTISGKTIEVLHTDAEGRVILSDVLEYAQKQKPDYLIDLATLTGACLVALGEEVAGIMGNDSKLIDRIKSAADESGERIWELPLVPEYADQMKSDVADIRNITGTRYGGAIMGGMFLQEFVNKGQPWAHLDIAGPAFAEKHTLSYVPKGGTGFGVRTLIHFLKSLR